MNKELNQSFTRLGIIAGIVLVVLLGGYLAGEEQFNTVLSVLMAIGLVLLGITILVTIHELGHFLTAKAFGMRVEIFSIGFPPKLFSYTKGETEYQIGATPLGGFVKISGIIDESLDTNHLSEAPKPYEFRSKPVWQRLIVMTGGVIMNVILGVFILSMMYFAEGERKTPLNGLEYGIEVVKSVPGLNRCEEVIQKTTLGYLLGFRTGDKLVSFKGNSYEYIEDYGQLNHLLESDGYYEVERNGNIVRLNVPEGVINMLSEDTIRTLLFSIRFPSQVKVIQTDSQGNMLPGAKANLKTGDVITAIDSIPIKYYSDLQEKLPGHGNQSLTLSILRNGKPMELVVQLDSASVLGVLPDSSFLNIVTKKYSFFQSFVPGTQRAFKILSGNAQGLGQVFTGKANASKSVMGPLAIAKRYLEIFLQGGWPGFLELTAMLSMILAFVNILPIPGLDGGHVVFLLIEAITRKEPSPKFRIITQQIGMVLVLGLMVVIIFNDVFRQFLYNCN